jgi:predicted ATPase
MKLSRVSISNFRGVREVELPLGSPPRALTAILGDNGSGKTTVLQAIALTISLATRRTRDPASFDWHGFLPERMASLGRSRIEIEVLLDEEEVTLTSELYQAWYDQLSSDWRQTRRIIEPSQRQQVTLVWDNGRLFSPHGQPGINQFLGRYYIKVLLKTQPEKRDLFSKLGDVFWFDQYRNLERATRAGPEDLENPELPKGWQAGVSQLREFLIGWWAYHTSDRRLGGKDYIPDTEQMFSRIFPGTKFVGVRPREQDSAGAVGDFYFLLERDGRVYDLEEMSSGEQAVFAMVYSFVRLGIAKSVVLVDELEMHLHPPGQQALLAALPKMGPQCQFLITTHSPYLEGVIPAEHEVRIAEKSLCL